jgi:hypothetical protein
MAFFGRSKTQLTPRQKAQRKYAAAMRSIRSRAKTTRGGRGRIGTRSAATKLRRKLGIGTAKRKTKRVTAKGGRTTRKGTSKAKRTVARRF